MVHFALLYDRRRGELVSIYEYDQRADAIRQRWAWGDKYRGDRNMEIVVLSAPDEKALHVSHGRYFKTFTQLAS